MQIKTSELGLKRKLCQRSFYFFIQEMWDSIVPEEPVWNWHIEYLADELQYIAERIFEGKPKEYDLIINISPGTTKSITCSVMFPIWCWTRMPSMQSICSSYTNPLALHLAVLSRDVLYSDKFRALFPEIEVRLDEKQKSNFKTLHGGQRIATSVGGSVTGMHGHVLITDDPLNPKEAAGKAVLDSTNHWLDNTLLTRKVDKKVTPHILIMQRLHQDDPTGHILEKHSDRLKHICLPAEDSYEIKPADLREYYVDGLMDPIRLSRDVLKEAHTDLGDFGYAGQFGQHPVPRSGGMFKVDNLLIVDAQPCKSVATVRYWDKAGTPGGGAYTVGVRMHRLTNGRFLVDDVVRGQWDSGEREAIIERTAARDGIDVQVGVEQEPGSGGKESAEATVRRLAGYHVRVDRPSGDKATRADPMSVQVNAGNFYLLRAPWNAEYRQELLYFPASKYKDQVDASSGAFAVLTSRRKRVGSF